MKILQNASRETAIFHDYFAIRGGGERLALILARAMEGSTLVYGYSTAETYDASSFPKKKLSLGIPSCLRKFGLHLPILMIAFRVKRSWAARFKIRFYSGVAAPFASPRRFVGNGVNIFYCHTPPRFLYDQRAHFLAKKNFFERTAAQLFMIWFAFAYRKAVARMDIIITNSENTQHRIRRYLNRDSIVVYPAVDTRQFVWRGQGDYYLSTARLTALKRVDKIIQSFLRMPEKKLIVASGGEELARLKALASGAPNITFLSWVSETELVELVGKAIATIYLPKDEDFGMSPVESMAAGKPVIGVKEGGLLETVQSGQTGILLKPDFSCEDIVAAVRSMTPERAISMRAACEAQAEKFSTEEFILNIQAVIKDIKEASN